MLQNEQDIIPFAQAQDATDSQYPHQSEIECDMASLNADISATSTPVSIQENAIGGTHASQVAMTTSDCHSADMGNLAVQKKKVRFAANCMVLYFDDSISHLSDSLSDDNTYRDELFMSDDDSVESLPLDDEGHVDEVYR